MTSEHGPPVWSSPLAGGLLPSTEWTGHCLSSQGPDFCPLPALWPWASASFSGPHLKVKGSDYLILEGPFRPKILWHRYTEEMWPSYLLSSHGVWVFGIFCQFFWDRDTEVKWLACSHRISTWTFWGKTLKLPQLLVSFPGMWKDKVRYQDEKWVASDGWSLKSHGICYVSFRLVRIQSVTLPLFDLW